VMSWSSSRSSSCLRALGRSLGKTCRHSCVGETFFVHGDGAREGPAVEKRSRVGCLVRSRPMPGIMPRPASAGNVGQQSLPRERASLTWQRLYVFRTQYRVAAESGVEYGFLDRVEAGHELRISLSARLTCHGHAWRMRLGNGSMPQAPWTFSGANFALSSIATMLLHRCDDAFLLDSETRGVFSYQSSPTGW
jgi:hypothetical protein